MIVRVCGAGATSEGSPGASGAHASAAASAADAASVKTRLRWTPELHEKFVDAVAQLGGSERKHCRSFDAFFRA